jgi:hypothetical protein
VIEREHELDAANANASTDAVRVSNTGDGSLGIGSLRAEAKR